MEAKKDYRPAKYLQKMITFLESEIHRKLAEVEGQLQMAFKVNQAARDSVNSLFLSVATRLSETKVSIEGEMSKMFRAHISMLRNVQSQIKKSLEDTTRLYKSVGPPPLKVVDGSPIAAKMAISVKKLMDIKERFFPLKTTDLSHELEENFGETSLKEIIGDRLFSIGQSLFGEGFTSRNKFYPQDGKNINKENQSSSFDVTK